MALYFLLGKLTDEGQKLLYNNPDHITETAVTLKANGAQLLGQYAVLGHYDLVSMVQADSNDSVARLSAEYGSKIGVHFETLSCLTINFMAHPTSDDLLSLIHETTAETEHEHLESENREALETIARNLTSARTHSGTFDPLNTEEKE